MPKADYGITPSMLAIDNNHHELGQILNKAGKAKVGFTQFVKDAKRRKLNDSD